MKDSWNELTIGNEINLLGGFPFSSSKFNEEGIGVPLIRIRDLLNSSQVTYYSGSYSNTYLINENDVLIGMDGDFHLVRWKNSPSLLNQRILRVCGKKSSAIDIDYLFYYLKPFLLDVHNKTAATTVKHLSTFNVSKAVDLFPPLPQQKKIAKILSTTDKVIEQTETAIAKYQAIKQGLMHDLFTRGIDINTGQLRPTPEDAPELYNESELGLIPKEWEVKRVDECLENLDGKRKPIKKEDRELLKGSIPYYGASGIIDYVNDYLFDEPLILLGEDGENVISRNTALAFKIEGKSWVNNHAHVLKPLKSNDIDFLTELLESMDYTNIISGSAQPKINQANLNKKLLSIPDFVEQINISKRINGLNQKIQTEQQALAKYQQLKAGLMQDLLTGEVEVSV